MKRTRASNQNVGNSFRQSHRIFINNNSYIISHLSIYINRGITRIFSVPEGYKGKYSYFPPSGYHSNQSDSLLHTNHHTIKLSIFVCAPVLSYVAHTEQNYTTVCTTIDIVYTDTGSRCALIDTNQEPISYHSICHMASCTEPS